MASTSVQSYYSPDMNITGVYHVGANTGQEYDFYKTLKCPVILFEPIVELCDIIRNKINLARDMVHNCALGDSTDPVRLNVASNDGNSSSVLTPNKHKYLYPEITFDKSIWVPQTLLDNFIDPRCNLLVIDTQGYELRVLRGAEKTLKHIDYIVVEVYGDDTIYDGASKFDEVNEFLESRGFKLSKKDMTWANWGNAFYKREK